LNLQGTIYRRGDLKGGVISTEKKPKNLAQHKKDLRLKKRRRRKKKKKYNKKRDFF